MKAEEITFETLDQMIAEAEATGMVLNSTYQNLWFTPAELRKENANGRFRWGPVNWELHRPEEHTVELINAVKSAEDNLSNWHDRLSHG